MSEKEQKEISRIELQNEFILIKPLTMETKGIVAVTLGEKGKIEDKKMTRGIVLKVSEKVKNYKEGDIVGWSLNGAFYRVIEIGAEMYLLLTPMDIAYVIRKDD